MEKLSREQEKIMTYEEKVAFADEMEKQYQNSCTQKSYEEGTWAWDMRIAAEKNMNDANKAVNRESRKRFNTWLKANDDTFHTNIKK